MATGYEPNIQGAIAALRDLMIANNVNMAREPYEPNYRGLVDAVIDLKEGFPTFAPAQVTFNAVAFENVERKVEKLKNEVLHDYVLKEDFLREMQAVHSKLDRILDHLLNK